MVRSQKTTGRATSMPAGLAVGAAVSAGLTFLLTALLAKLLDMETLAWENIGYGIMIMLLIASFGGAMVSYAKVKRQRMLVCAASGVIYFAILLSITALFFGGQFEAVGVTAALVFGGSITAGLLGHHGGGGRRRKRQIVHR